MRLIDADKLLEAFSNSKHIKETTSGLCVMEMEAIKEIIDNAETYNQVGHKMATAEGFITDPAWIKGKDCMDEDAKQASVSYTYNAPQHDWKCGYPDITRGEEESKNG